LGNCQMTGLRGMCVEHAERDTVEGQGGLAPLRRRAKYLSGVNAVMVELHGVPLSWG
jgi:hypothetical protein